MNIKMSKKNFSLLIISILFVLAACTSNTDTDTMKVAPDFTLKAITGEKISLKDFKGDVVLVDFWATWCGPCRMSIPELVHLQDKYRDKGVVILGISVDNLQQADDVQLQRFTEKYKMNYHVMRDDIGVMEMYIGGAMASIPTMFIVNREGEIVETVIGFSPGKVEKTVQSLL